MAIIYILLLLFATFSDHPRLHVEGRSLNKEADVTTTEIYDELTTTQYDEQTTIEPATIKSIKETNLTEESNNNGITLDISRFTSPSNRSLYDELKAEEEANQATSIPLFTLSEFLASSEDTNLSNDENKSSLEMSLESAFKDNENDFKSNATKEEHHHIDEIRIDEQSVKYSSRNQTMPDESNEDEEVEAKEEVTTTTTALPLKKGKYLDLMPPGEDNMNASLPNTAEVWALAGMLKVDSRKSSSSASDDNDVELLNDNMNNTVKTLLDWTEIAKHDDNETTTTTTVKPIQSVKYDDASTAENKEVAVSTASIQMATTEKSSIVDDSRVELEHENVEFNNVNKSQTVISRIDTDIFNGKSHSSDENEKNHDDVEILPINRNDNGKEHKKENLIENNTEFETTTTTAAATESTPSSSLLFEEEATTMESDEVDATTMTSGIDSFTIIGEDDDESGNDNVVAKRTITEMPESDELTTITLMPSTTSTPATTTTFYEIPTTTEMLIESSSERFNKSTMVTKSISIRIATTTERPDEIETTSDSSEVFASSTTEAAAYDYDAISSTSSNAPVEITDDDKFRYNTLLPETTTTTTTTMRTTTIVINLLDSSRSGKNGDVYSTDGSIGKDSDLNKSSLDGETQSGNVVIISVSISIVVFILLAAGGFLLFKNRKKQLTTMQRCRPVGLDAYSLDNVSVYNSVRRKANALRLSKRSYGNSAFEDPSLQSNVLDYQSLQDFSKNKTSIHDEFKEIPQISVRVEEVPENCEDKNRYANVIPLPETRVHLQRLNDDEKTEYINANYVKGPKDNTNYYIATQAPLECTVPDFWRMIWEQNSKVIVMVTDLTENGVERCAEYIPASVVLDNSSTYGDFQVTLKSREVKGKYAVSQLHLKNLKTNTWREIMHLWYSWPDNGSPTDESSVIGMLLEARGYLRTSLPEHLDENSNAENNNNVNDKEKLSTLDKTKSLQRVQGPLTVHCSPGTGRTGTIIACDIVLRMLETPPRQIDIPQIVYHVRRGRASAVRTKDQYEFIYSIANAYAIKLNTGSAET